MTHERENLPTTADFFWTNFVGQFHDARNLFGCGVNMADSDEEAAVGFVGQVA